MRHPRAMRVILVLLTLAIACGSESVCPPGTHESGPICVLDDAGVDAGGDAANDGSSDAMADAGQPDSTIDGCVATRFYRDLDGDGHGDTNSSIEECAMPEGYVAAGDDCDDDCADCHPGGTEICDPDNRDEDCSNSAAEACMCTEGDGRCHWGCENGMCNDVVQLAKGFGFTCALRRTGRVDCWGHNVQDSARTGGSLGRPTTEHYDLRAGAVLGLPPAVEVASGGGIFTCARTAAGKAWCWGNNDYGQIGVGSADVSVPLPRELALSNVRSLGLGVFHACAIVNEGEVWCWGLSEKGTLGDGSRTFSRVPVRASGIADAVKVVGARHFTCALHRTGDVSCWGQDRAGFVNSGTPQRIPSLAASIDIEAGDEHMCAIGRDHHVRCFGMNESGQIGDGTMTARPLPVAPTGLGEVVAVSGGFLHSCALLVDRTVACFGANADGQLGNNSVTPSPTFVPVTGLTNVHSIEVGHLSSCALTMTGAAYCWGNGEIGQLGDGAYVDRLLPTPVSPPPS